MTKRAACLAIAVTLLPVLMASTAAAQLAPNCVENSPERRGEVGCSFIQSKLLPDGLKQPLFWTLIVLTLRSVPAQQLAQQASHSRPPAHRGS